MAPAFYSCLFRLSRRRQRRHRLAERVNSWLPVNLREAKAAAVSEISASSLTLGQNDTGDRRDEGAASMP